MKSDAPLSSLMDSIASPKVKTTKGKVGACSNSQSGSSLGSVKVHSFTLSYIPKNMRCDSQASFLARTLANLCLGRDPKARVATKLRKNLHMKELRYLLYLIYFFNLTFFVTLCFFLSTNIYI
jgi:hypothetical protein